MNNLIEIFITELRRVLIDKMVTELLGELSPRDVTMIIIGMIATLLILSITT